MRDDRSHPHGKLAASFAVMERLGLTRVASFDDDFAIYRYGRTRDKAFDVLR